MSRLLAVGDLHGHLAPFDRLLDAIAPAADDTFVCIGDYVDRGPNSRGVIDRVRDLRGRTQLVPLLGNHEAMMLAARADDRGLEGWLLSGGLATLQSYADAGTQELDFDRVPAEHWRFIERECVRYYETATHLFAHANVDQSLPLADQADDDLLWQKLRGPVRHVSGKVLVVGHTPQPGGRPLVTPTTLCIDTGVYLPHGWLTAVDLSHGWCWQASHRGEFRQFSLDDIERREG